MPNLRDYVWYITHDSALPMPPRRSWWQRLRGKTMELIAMQPYAAKPNTLVAFDLVDGERIFGTFVRYGTIKYDQPIVIEGNLVTTEESIVVLHPDTNEEAERPYRLVTHSWWAPAGWRP